jgi:Trypsin-like peptidase domain
MTTKPLTVLVLCLAAGFALSPLLLLDDRTATPPFPPVVSSPVDAAGAVWLLLLSDGSYGSAEAVACDPLPDGQWSLVLLTAGHVVRTWQDGVTAEAHLGDRTCARCYVLSRAPDCDLALVAVESPGPCPVFRVRTHDAVTGEDVWSVGYGGSHQGFVHVWLSRGVACSADAATVPLWFGDSGGALVDAAGALVGVLDAIPVGLLPSGIAMPIPSHGLVVPASRSLPWMSAVLRAPGRLPAGSRK